MCLWQTWVQLDIHVHVMPCCAPHPRAQANAYLMTHVRAPSKKEVSTEGSNASFNAKSVLGSDPMVQTHHMLSGV